MTLQNTRVVLTALFLFPGLFFYVHIVKQPQPQKSTTQQAPTPINIKPCPKNPTPNPNKWEKWGSNKKNNTWKKKHTYPVLIELVFVNIWHVNTVSILIPCYCFHQWITSNIACQYCTFPYILIEYLVIQRHLCFDYIIKRGPCKLIKSNFEHKNHTFQSYPLLVKGRITLAVIPEKKWKCDNGYFSSSKCYDQHLNICGHALNQYIGLFLYWGGSDQSITLLQ